MNVKFMTLVRTAAFSLAATLVWAHAALGSPLGLPPGPVDQGVLQAAPEECLFYLGWNGAGKADASSENQTEQLMAEAEVQQFISQIDQQVTALAQQALQANPALAPFAQDLPALVKGVLTHPLAFYVSKAGLGPMGPDVQAGLIINTGEMQPTFAKAVAQLEAMALANFPPGMQLEELDVGGAKLHKAPLPPGAPSVVWGFKDSYFLISVGADAGQELVTRLTSGSPPAWLAQVQEQAGIDRPGTTWYVNLAGILQSAQPFLARDPKVPAVLAALGIQDVSYLSGVEGFDGTGMASKTFVATGGDPKGIFAALTGEPLTAADLQLVPEDVNFAVAARLDPAKIMSHALEIVGKIDPAAREQADGALAGVDAQLGFSLADDLLAGLGDLWCAYGVEAKPEAGKPAPQMGAITVTVTVRDREQFEPTYQAVIDRLKQQAEQSDGAWTVKKSNYRGQEVYYVPLKLEQGQAPATPLPFNFDAASSGLTPCWCLTDERLVICTTPQALKAFITRDPSAPSLAARPEVAGWLDGSRGPLAITWSDTAAGLRSAYPQLQALLPLASVGAASAGLPLQLPPLPSLESLESHALPSLLLLEQTDAGLVVESHQSVPVINSRSIATTGVAVALLLPAVQAAREAARRSQSTNNLKLIGLGMMNHADVYKAFPAAAICDESGKPLLSWRVAILPFVGEKPLYDSFHRDEPWDSDHNKALIAQMPAVYQNPNLPLDEGKTSYVAVVGEDAVIQPTKQTTFAAIRDGTSNTIVGLVTDEDHAVIWTQPDDWSPDDDDPMVGLLRQTGGILLALFADGSVRPINENLEPDTFKALLTRDGGEAVNLDGN